MHWADVKEANPNQWLVIEALEAHIEENRRILDRIAAVEVCPDSAAAMQAYRRLHQQYPLREFYFVHTSRASLNIGDDGQASGEAMRLTLKHDLPAVINLYRLQLQFPSAEA